MRFTIDFQIIGNCNMQCQFCCGPAKGTSGPTTKEFFSIIDTLKDAGVTTIVITGGEPLLRTDIVDCLKYAFQKGLETYLSTNGLLLSEEKYLEIKHYVNLIGLPLDGSTTDINKKISRSPLLFNNTDRLLKIFYKNNPIHQVKIGTVVSKVNINDLENIGRYLFENPNFKAPDTWRLYEFSPLGDGKKNRKKFEITTNEFNKIINKLKKRFPNANISALTNEDSNDSYFFIHPTMQLQVLTNDIYQNLGDVRKMNSTDLLRIIDNYKSAIKKSDHNRSWIKK